MLVAEFALSALCAEVGCGKTIEILALILSNPPGPTMPAVGMMGVAFVLVDGCTWALSFLPAFPPLFANLLFCFCLGENCSSPLEAAASRGPPLSWSLPTLPDNGSKASRPGVMPSYGRHPGMKPLSSLPAALLQRSRARPS